MSLLADLLSKVKQPSSKKDIPPNLKNIVSDSVRRSALKRKLLFLSFVFIGTVALGFLIIYLMQFYQLKTGDRGQVIDSQIGAQKDKGAVVRAGAPTLKSEGVEKQDGEVRKQKGEGSKLRSKINLPDSKRQKERDRTTALSVSSEQPAVDNQQITIDDRQLISDTRANADVHLYSAREYEIKKDYSKALYEYKKVIEIEKDNFGAMNNIAYLLLQLGQAEESIKYSEMALNINNNYVPALINLAVACTKLGNITDAEAYLKRALMIESSNTSVLLNLALLYERKGDYHTASEYFSKLATSGDITGSLGFARIYERQNKIEDALKVYKNIYALNSIDNKTRQFVKERISFLSGKETQ